MLVLVRYMESYFEPSIAYQSKNQKIKPRCRMENKSSVEQAVWPKPTTAILQPT
ncbi:MAG: hypothetical protein UT65_C0010G0009 [Parcubacteria group bacterium GW2011_GWF2_39_8b]|nr:MAG: hypothetical protein UT65_C0010G0009 [Parcubacteria group bacterium GW2011_GWF2_39_8b]KKR45255.1 MAG: hypothetical protein UT81_C0018G0017 [Parcubacteria group bacterium GW2011_GWA2_40_14]